MNGKEIVINTFDCQQCNLSIKYNIHSSVSYVDAFRAFTHKCRCEE
jgi:transcription elongation factor Elf1